MKTKTYQTRLTNRVPFSTRHARNNSLLGVLAVWLLRGPVPAPHSAGGPTKPGS